MMVFTPGNLSGASQVPPNGLVQSAGFNTVVQLAFGRFGPERSACISSPFFARDYLPPSAIAQVNFPAAGRLLHIEFLVGRFEQLLHRCATWRVRGDPDAQRQSRLFRAAL